MNEQANHPAAGKAGIASGLAIGHHWPGLPEPGRWAQSAGAAWMTCE
jgi:hypothetical protein